MIVKARHAMGTKILSLHQNGKEKDTVKNGKLQKQEINVISGKDFSSMKKITRSQIPNNLHNLFLAV